MSEESDAGNADDSISEGDLLMKRMDAQQKLYELQGNMNNISEN